MYRFFATPSLLCIVEIGGEQLAMTHNGACHPQEEEAGLADPDRRPARHLNSRPAMDGLLTKVRQLSVKALDKRILR